MTEDARHKEVKIWSVSIDIRNTFLVEANTEEEAEDKALELSYSGVKPNDSEICGAEARGPQLATEYY